MAITQKFVVALVVMVAFMNVTNAFPLTIWQDGVEWLKEAAKSPESGEDVRVRLNARIEHRLGLLDTATTICFRTVDDNFNVRVGSQAFALQWWCGISDCRWNYQLGANLFPSTAKSASPVTWGTPAPGTDLSYTNKGVGKTRGGSRPDYLFGMTNEQFEASNLPGRTEEVFMKCYINNEGSYYTTNLNSDIELESTDPDEDSDWVVQNIHLNAPDTSD